MLAYATLILSVLFGIAAYVAYYRDQGKVTSNRWAWLIWGATTIVEALTFEAVSGDFIKSAVFFVSGISCIIVTVRVWRSTKWKRPNLTEIASVIASAIAIVLWLGFHEAWWAHVVVVIAIPISFLPSWKDAVDDPESEASCAWGLWSIGDFLAIITILIRLDSDKELPYAITEFACHALMWVLVWRVQIARVVRQCGFAPKA